MQVPPEVPLYTAAELEDLPTLSVGQADDLKKEDVIDGVSYRWWLCRCGTADGMPYDDQVTIEHWGPHTDFRWTTLTSYPG